MPAGNQTLPSQSRDIKTAKKLAKEYEDGETD